jgi:hypothetical protein
MTSLNPFGEGYLRLTLEIDKHIDGYIDSYYGPPEIKAEISASEKKSAAALRDDVRRLRDLLPTDNPARHTYMGGVLRAMNTTLRLLEGEQIDYLEEVALIYDIAPHKIDEAVFEAANKDLDGLLPGSGPTNERFDAWRKQYELSPDKLVRMLELTRDETHRRTVEMVTLVPGEAIDVALTSNQPWSAYNWFKGNAFSLIEFNTDVPVSAIDLANLFAHEGYPGHHTEHQLKEQHLYKEKGYTEYASALLHSPSAVIAEGIATTAAEIIFPDDSIYDWTCSVLLPAAGLPAIEPDHLRRITQAREIARAVSCNAAILFHRGEINAEQAVEYIRTYALSTEKRARQSFSFITNPLFRSYIFTYTEGYKLIEQAAKGGDKRPLFERLLHEEILPSALNN